MAIAISFFLLPNQLSTGGFVGIATITYYLFKLPISTVVLILNIPLFIMAFIRVGKTFVAKSIAGTVILSIFIDWLDKYEALTTDKLLASIYGGILVGLGLRIGI